jgi:hypothetical protein
MLFHLELLDVVVGQRQTERRRQDQDTNSRLRCNFSTESAAGDHKCACITDENQGNDNVAIDAVKEDCSSPDGRDELEDHQNACREDGGQMEE